ncbi:hypothetical protein [Blastochloris sulfoviridis]|uniref:Uncharacterized protein n=1 Tax=Blastochloris sulfoviridis TaxID=50712 RepID=A0A5M6HXC0_9HYPH|nr:hypothetical protein [Blastochloris sulfoviridis]KAA5600365.1 hypothetical protein F1193_10710 [Blastochloris sulfoviridis]
MSEPSESVSHAAEAVADAEQRRAALTYLGEAWDEATVDGLDPDCLVQAAIFLAFQELVAVYGEQPAASFAEGLAARVRAGEYTVYRVQQ